MCSDDDEDDDEDRGAGDMYADFFTDGGREGAAQDSEEDDGKGLAPKAKRRKGQKAAATANRGDDDGVDEDGWDGEQLFDTGEGREGELSRHASLSAGLQNDPAGEGFLQIG